MPVVNNQNVYPVSGEYKGTIITSPAILPDPEPIPQTEPNIVKPTLSETGTKESVPTFVPKTNLGFGVITVEGEADVTANKYMSSFSLVEGNNISITTNPITSSITISSTGTGQTSILPGTSINVTSSNNAVTINNTMTETVYSGGDVSGTLTPNRNNGTIQKFTLTGNITLSLPTNMSAGQSLTLILTQDSSGNRLLDANVGYLFASGFQTLSTSSGSIDMLNIFSDGSTYYITLTVDYS